MPMEVDTSNIKLASPVPPPAGIASGMFNGRLPAMASSHDEFVRELVQLCNFHGKTKHVMLFHLSNARFWLNIFSGSARVV